MKKRFNLTVLLFGFLHLGCDQADENAISNAGNPTNPILSLSFANDTARILSDTLVFAESDSIKFKLRVENAGNKEWRYVQLWEANPEATLDSKSGSFSWTPSYEDGNQVDKDYEFILAAVYLDSIITKNLVIKIKNKDRLPFSSIVAHKTQNGPGGKRDDGGYDTNKVLLGIIAMKDPDGDSIEFQTLYTPDGGLFRDSDTSRIEYLKFHFGTRTLDSLVENKFDLVEFGWATELRYEKADSLVFSFGNLHFRDTVTVICNTTLRDNGFPEYICSCPDTCNDSEP